MNLPVPHADGRIGVYDVAGRGVLSLSIRKSTPKPVEIPMAWYCVLSLPHP